MMCTPALPAATYATLLESLTSFAFPESASDAATTGTLRLLTFTTCKPDAPAAMKAKFPFTSTLLAKPGMATNPRAVGEKVRTTAVACALNPLFEAVITQEPLEPAKTFPSGTPKLHTVRSLDE